MIESRFQIKDQCCSYDQSNKCKNQRKMDYWYINTEVITCSYEVEMEYETEKQPYKWNSKKNT